MSNPACLECKEFGKGSQNVEMYTQAHIHTHTHVCRNKVSYLMHSSMKKQKC